MSTFLNLLRCLLLVYGISFLSYQFFIQRINYQQPICYYIGLIILLLYTILAIDTYVFHTLTWFPGILRYPMFSLYGVAYIIFVIPGFLLCFKE